MADPNEAWRAGRTARDQNLPEHGNPFDEWGEYGRRYSWRQGWRERDAEIRGLPPTASVSSSDLNFIADGRNARTNTRGASNPHQPGSRAHAMWDHGYHVPAVPGAERRPSTWERQGGAARSRNIDIATGNPYPANSQAHISWNDGWNLRDAVLRMRVDVTNGWRAAGDHLFGAASAPMRDRIAAQTRQLENIPKVRAPDKAPPAPSVPAPEPKRRMRLNRYKKD